MDARRCEGKRKTGEMRNKQREREEVEEIQQLQRRLYNITNNINVSINSINSATIAIKRKFAQNLHTKLSQLEIYPNVRESVRG